MKVKKCITIEKDQDDYVSDQKINLSKLTQERIDELRGIRLVLKKRLIVGLPKSKLKPLQALLREKLK